MIYQKLKNGKIIRLVKEIVIDKKTFGMLKFSVLRKEICVQNDDEAISNEVKERT